MLRRHGCFSRQAYGQPIIPTAEDEGNVLEAKWLGWIRQESLKRSDKLMLKFESI